MSVKDIKEKLKPLEVKTYLGWLECSNVDPRTYANKTRNEDLAETIELQLTYLQTFVRKITLASEKTQQSFWEVFGDLKLQKYNGITGGTYLLNYVKDCYAKSKNIEKIKEINTIINKEKIKEHLKQARKSKEVKSKFKNYHECLNYCKNEEDFEPVYKEAMEEINKLCNARHHPFIQEFSSFESILNIEHNFRLGRIDKNFLNDLYEQLGRKAINARGYEGTLSAQGVNITHLVKNGIKWLEHSGVRKRDKITPLEKLYEGYIHIGDSVSAVDIYKRIQRIKK